MLRPRCLRVCLPRNTAQRRCIHHLPPLEQFKDGIPGLFTPGGFHIAWTEYQTLMLEKLNALTAGSVDDYSNTTKNLLLKYARQPSMASIFNHSSMAHNNHFFFSCLSTNPTTMPSTLRSALEGSFGSLDTLKREFVATGNAMFGPGYVWLVQIPSENKFAILNTYIAGSPYPGAHWRRQPVDMNTEATMRNGNNNNNNNNNSADPYARRDALLNSEPVNTVGSHGPLSAKAKLAPGGVALNPVLCVSTWQHVYMPDWGVLQKKQFLEAWWERIDWSVVANNATALGNSKFLT